MSFLYSLNRLFFLTQVLILVGLRKKILLANYIIILTGREGPAMVSLGVEVDTYHSSRTDQLPI